MGTKTLKSYRLDDYTIADIEALKVSLNAGSNSEVIRRAITTLRELNDTTKSFTPENELVIERKAACLIQQLITKSS